MNIGPDQIAMKYETNLSLKRYYWKNYRLLLQKNTEKGTQSFMKIGKTFESGFKLNSTYTSREPNCVKASRPA